MKWWTILIFGSLIANSMENPFSKHSAGHKIEGIVLVRETLYTEKELMHVKGVQIGDVELPGKDEPLEEALELYIGKPFTPENLKGIKQEIYKYYRDNDQPLVIVQIPWQDREIGVAQIIIRESKIGAVKVVGNEWSSTKRYTDHFGKPGEKISQKAIRKEVDFLNKSPFRVVNVSYSPGDKDYTTDLTVQVTDRRPYFFYAGCDNTGVPTTGRQRIFAGFVWDQIGGTDQSLYYQYTTNYSTRRFHSNTFQYTALCPWKAIVNIYGGFSTVHATLHPMPMNNHGTNIQGSIRYITPLQPSKTFSCEIIGGFDIKNTNNTLEFTDTTPVFGQTVNIAEWMFGYKCRYETLRLSISGGVEGVFSPFQWLPNQTSADYESLRPGADNKWFYALAYCNLSCALPKAYSLHFRANGEWSNQVLLPSEQLGIGGHASVRGYDERQYNGDSGLIASVEAHSPDFALLRSKNPHAKNAAYFLLFADGGFGFENKSVEGVHHANYLASSGVGLRYYLSDYLKARIDYGVKLHHQDGFTGGASMVHFGVTGSF